MDSFFAAKTVVLGLVLASALYYDLKEQKIKNFITFPGALAGAGINFFEGGFNGLLLSLQGWFAPLLLLMVFYYIKVMGAGDIKLFAALGAIMGMPFVAYSFLYTVYIGAGIALFLLIKRRNLLSKLEQLWIYFRNCFLTGRVAIYSSTEGRDSKFIFTLAIVPGTLLYYCQLLLEIGKRM